MPERPLEVQSEEEDEEYELVDKFNSTQVHPDAGKEAPYKRTQLGNNCEFIGDGIEKLMCNGQNIKIGETPLAEN